MKTEYAILCTVQYMRHIEYFKYFILNIRFILSEHFSKVYVLRSMGLILFFFGKCEEFTSLGMRLQTSRSLLHIRKKSGNQESGKKKV